MGQCKDCKFWRKNYLNNCEGMYCDRANHWMPNSDQECSIEVAVADDTGLSTLLITKPLFGCVNFEEGTL